MRNLSRIVMDPSVNPLANLPPAQRFQTMVVLSVMWSTIFCAMAGVWFLYGALVIGHLLFLLGVVATGFTFRSARRTGTSPKRPDVENSES